MSFDAVVTISQPIATEGAAGRSQNEYFYGTWMRRQTSGSVPVRTTKNWCTGLGRGVRFARLLGIGTTLATPPSGRRDVPSRLVDAAQRAHEDPACADAVPSDPKVA